MRTPVSTYRLQVSPAFPLDDVAAICDFVRALGADWIYLSPLLASEPGSAHGYDVVDHARVDPQRGGADGFARAVEAARRAGLGVLVDLVPNHVGVATPRHMAWWWDVLANGRASAYADAFDIDWDFGGGRLRIPVLGSAADVSELRLVGGVDDSLELAYFDHRFPVADGTASGLDDDPIAVHDRQHYELIDWRRADDALNYRRFFGVNSLAAIRVEDPAWFDASHAEVLRWVREGLVDGLRIDHPDGLRDPGGYLDRLAAATASDAAPTGRYVLVEKIVEGDEPLPPTWPTAGTTGYDALGDVDRVLVDPAGEAVLSAFDAELRAGDGASAGAHPPLDWAELIHRTKRGIADGLLHSEVLRLSRELDGPDHGDRVADALAELLAGFPVYRSYLPFGAEHLATADARARAHRPDLADELDRVVPRLSDVSEPAALRFQQTSGMVMAKGVEDTAFYRTSRLTSLAEVGGEPDVFAIDPASFHARQRERAATHPFAMTTLSTHDTKRGEDTRARIDAIAEPAAAAEWIAGIRELEGLVGTGDGVLDHLLWQAIVGAWPADRDRLHAYAEKAAREAGDSTRWTDPDADFESRMHALVDAAVDDPAARPIVERLVGMLRAPGWSNGLAAKLLQLTMPGVPDVYQGSELWETSLVDPDNRRPVDFGERGALLARLDAGWLPPLDETGAVKLLVTSRALRARRDRPELFTGYGALEASGPAAAHLVGFDRGGAVTLVTRFPRGLADAGGWADTVVRVPGRAHRHVDAVTGLVHEGEALRLAEVFARYPVALLLPEHARPERGDLR